MPPHDTYNETHYLGGGAIMKRKAPALRTIGIDRDERALSQFACDTPVELVHGCAHRFLADFDYQGRELVYCDPPYLHATRSSKRRYRYDYEESDHIALLALLKTLPCAVILSGYPSALYDESLPGWQSLELQVMNQGGVRTEKLWFNFRPSHGERSEGEEPAGPAVRPAMGVGPGGWPQATCKDIDTPSSHCGRASCAPEKRTARPQDGRGQPPPCGGGRAEVGAEAQRVR
ncbi:hypothetical protein A9R16_003305 [Acidiferrobacter thiooxydans]|uniref:hypothetical protein n=1 Tax=Acidiferrobacter thiooxydans TaxID=163359 RepID=UPI001E2E6263|nr:hypothetical protein [Acidiferrobacter thiooxydans]UEO00442.1 hypothetical protein A9R16_003305 [Acidiferrobacter thiooxydans]